MEKQKPQKLWRAPLLAAALAWILAGCAAQPEAAVELTPPPTTPPAYTTVYKDGRYTATAPGYGGEVSVTLTVVEDVVTELLITGESETRGVGSIAIDRMPERILAAQTGPVDGVSGATQTSDAIKTAFAAALEKAKNPPPTPVPTTTPEGE